MTQEWEKAEFPILCEECLGPNPYVRMIKDAYGRECKICQRPFTVFKWSPGVGERWKKSEICQVCSKIKNCCQTCLLDLEYGLHTRDRDEVLQIHHSIPTTDVNAQVFVRSIEEKMGGAAVVNQGKAESVAKEVLKKLVKAKTDPYTRRNKTSICSFYIKGNCKRDKDCPFLHQMPETKKASKKIVKEAVKEEKQVEPVIAPSLSENDQRYPSQNPALLGTSSRSFRA